MIHLYPDIFRVESESLKGVRLLQSLIVGIMPQKPFKPSAHAEASNSLNREAEDKSLLLMP